MAGSSRAKGAAIRQLITVVVLFLLLIALAVAYYLMTRPPELSGQGERDRSFMFSIYGFEGDLLRRPTGVGFDDEGNLYVADTGKKRVVVFDGDGNYIRVFGEAGKGPLQLWNPIDVEVAPDGRMFVVDKSQSKIVEYDRSGRAVRDITTPEPATSIAIKDNLMYVTTDSGVLIADTKGNLQTGYIKRGKKPGEFDRPGGVAVGADGTLYVADSLNYRVQAISPQGKPLWQYGKPIPADKAVQFDSDDRKFGLPASIAIDENDLIYVVDGLNHEVEVLDINGEPIEVIGDTGHADGSFYYPDGIDYYDGRIAIADKFNDRVEVFRTPVPPGQAWRSYIPYALLLLLLPLLLLPFLLRRQKYVLTPQAAELLLADTEGAAVAEAMKRVTGTTELAAWGEEHKDELGLRWDAVDADDEDVATVSERYGLAAEEAAALVIAAGTKGKRVLIGEGAPLQKAASELQVPVVTYTEIKAVLAEKTKSGAKKKPPAPESPAFQEGDE